MAYWADFDVDDDMSSDPKLFNFNRKVMETYTRKLKEMNEKDKYNRNKFYVGSNSVFSRNWGHRTLNEAVKHASTILDKSGADTEIFVVKIVKIVKHKKQPVEVVDVK